MDQRDSVVLFCVIYVCFTIMYDLTLLHQSKKLWPISTINIRVD